MIKPPPLNRIRLFCLLLLAVVRPVAAAEGEHVLDVLPMNQFVDATSLEKLGDMVVTESKIAQAADSVTQKIVVLNNDDMQSRPDNNRNIAEQMQYTSGQFVNVLSRNDANWGSYAGLGPKYNSYLLDGLPIDSFVDPMNLDLNAIDHIEVHKGPASVLYSNYMTMDFVGNEAPLAGTTNLVMKNRIDKDLTRLAVGMGSFNTVTGNGYTQGHRGDWHYFGGAGTETSDYAKYGRDGSWLDSVKSPDYQKSKFFGNITYDLGRPDHTVSLFIHHTLHDGNMGRPNRDFHHDYNTVNFSYNNQLNDDWHLQFKTGERRYDRLFANDLYEPKDRPMANFALDHYENTRQTIRPADLTLSYRHLNDSLLTFGADGQWVHYTTSTGKSLGRMGFDNDAEIFSMGYFAQEKFQWRDWVWRLGIRHNVITHDYRLMAGHAPQLDSKSWEKTLWSAGWRYNVNAKLAFYGNAGSSFMVPSAKQIAGTVQNPATESGELANPNLKPEEGIGSDVGIDWRPVLGLELGARAFLNSIDNAIVTNVVSSAPSQSRSENAGSAQAYGLELDARYQFDPYLTVFANFTRTHSRVKNHRNLDQDGTAIPFSPDNIVNSGITANLPWGSKISPYFHWVGRYYDSASTSERHVFGDYLTVNVRLQQPLERRLDLVIDLNNIGNSRYAMPFDFRDLGFNGFASLNLTF